MPSDNLVRGHRVLQRPRLRRHAHRRAELQGSSARASIIPTGRLPKRSSPKRKDSIQSITHSKNYCSSSTPNGIVGRLVKYTLDTRQGGRGQAAGRQARSTSTVPDFRTDQCIVFTTSWIQPTTLYDFDAEKDTFAKSIFNTAIAYPGFENLVTEEVEVPGHDGTMVPLSIIHRKDLKLDGSASAILEGYGAYGIS